MQCIVGMRQLQPTIAAHCDNMCPADLHRVINKYQTAVWGNLPPSNSMYVARVPVTYSCMLQIHKFVAWAYSWSLFGIVDMAMNIFSFDNIITAVPILRFKVRSTDAWRARRARAYNGGLGAKPPSGSRGRAPGQEVRGAKPPEAESLLAFQRPIAARKITTFTVSSKLRVCDVSGTFNRIPNISLLKTG